MLLMIRLAKCYKVLDLSCSYAVFFKWLMLFQFDCLSSPLQKEPPKLDLFDDIANIKDAEEYGTENIAFETSVNF